MTYKVPPFRCPVPRRCAQCKEKIAPGKKVWTFDHHVFDSLDCVDAWITIGSLL